MSLLAASEYSMVRPATRDAMGFSQNSEEALYVLSQGAHILELSEQDTFAVAWFPKNYRNQAPRRTLFVLHGSNGNAYQGIYHQLTEAKKHGYGLVALKLEGTKTASDVILSKLFSIPLESPHAA